MGEKRKITKSVKTSGKQNHFKVVPNPKGNRAERRAAAKLNRKNNAE